MTTMADPAHLGESRRDAMDAQGWTGTEPAATLDCTRRTFSRLLNGRPGISPAMALEPIGGEDCSVLGTAPSAGRLGPRAAPPAGKVRFADRPW